VVRTEAELGFLLDYLSLPRFRGDLALEFRGPSELSVYDRGFRLAQVRFGRTGSYRVRTHTKFIYKTPLADESRYPRVAGPKDYATFECPADRIHHLLQAKHISAMRPRIAEIAHREEIGISHIIAADNSRGRDVMVIDREVGDSAPEHRGERLDLLALQKLDDDAYRFLTIEVKLGNNPELDITTRKRRDARSAVEQVLGYREQIDKYFDDYAECYRENIAQKLRLRIIRNGWEQPPAIRRGAAAMLVVAGYRGIAEPHLEAIAREHPELWLKVFGYGVESRGGVVQGLFSPPSPVVEEAR